MRAKDVLLDAVKHFEGTVLFVSHDRYFIDGTATRVFEVEDGHVHVYPGNYEDYQYRKGVAASASEAEMHDAPVAKSMPALNGTVAASTNGNGHADIVKAVPETAPAAAKNGTVAKKVNPIKLRQMQERLVCVEEEVPRCEAAIAVTEGQMANYTSAEEMQRLAAQLERLRAEHGSLQTEWETLMLELEEQGVAG